ncbi:hypothetical protein [Parasitella parasitica]|uniref:Uncharacterized protein n=1 Tax=Parasitella parasitica TaxID=35722 RepID=A0A0B7NKU7_9FUNG|nr:hypothetical protein [Parasitella parasitica]
MSTIITQTKKNPKLIKQQQQQRAVHLPDVLHLNLRGTCIDLDKNTLVLPETVLRILFPQGLLEDAKEYKSDFDPKMLAYILDHYKSHKSKFLAQHSQFNEDAYLAHAVATGTPLSPLLTRQGVVVLLEELVYFVICENSSSVKQTSLKLLLDQDSIFDANSRPADFVDILRLAGFGMEDKWQVRSQEPNVSSIHSIALASIKYDNRLQIGQKLMMFRNVGGIELFSQSMEKTSRVFRPVNYGVAEAGLLNLFWFE